MRQLTKNPTTPLIKLAGVALGAGLLTACGGGSVNSLPGELTYAVGGSVSGLSGTLVLENNGGDDLSLASDGAFTFPTRMAQGGAYSITVAAQPAGEVCAVSDAAGMVDGTIGSIAVVCMQGSATLGQWSFLGGSNQIDEPGAYGSAGVVAAGNQPGAREAPAAWTDSAGNFWLFGGWGIDASGDSGLLEDLWEYQPAAGQWVWLGGTQSLGGAPSYGMAGVASQGNSPGAREAAQTWSDAAGRLWLFGGSGEDSGSNVVNYQDLWMYDPTSGDWVWIGGQSGTGGSGQYGVQGIPAPGNLPPARSGAATWVDSAGVFWLYGGAQYDNNGITALLNDLWSYDPSTGEWTWVSGDNAPNAQGRYGTQGIAAPGNAPGARVGVSVWQDANGNVWLMGGYGVDQVGTVGELSDLWEYAPASGEWTFVQGVSHAGASGAYGSRGVSASGNAPGARASAAAWTDAAGRFWLFGGFGYDSQGSLQDLSDLWEFDPASGQWTWMSGSPLAAASGNYAQHSAAITNLPGAREQSAHWVDGSGTLWLFGGYGFDAFGDQDDLNDLWALTP